MMKLLRSFKVGEYFTTALGCKRWKYKSVVRFDDTGDVVHTFFSDIYFVDIKVDGTGAIISAYVAPLECRSVITLGVTLGSVPCRISFKMGLSYDSIDELGVEFNNSLATLREVTDLIEYLGAIS